MKLIDEDMKRVMVSGMFTEKKGFCYIQLVKILLTKGSQYTLALMATSLYLKCKIIACYKFLTDDFLHITLHILGNDSKS